MTLEELHKELSYVNASRDNRMKHAKMVLNNLELLPKLMTIVFTADDKISCRAAWVLEYVCSQNIFVIVPYLDVFVVNLYKIHFDSAVRPIAKICELLAKAYSKQELTLLPEHKEHIIETCFDWMIKDEKVAVKAYSMNTLFLLGKDYNWVFPELKQILERDFYDQSAAYKARARQILKKIKKRLFSL